MSIVIPLSELNQLFGGNQEKLGNSKFCTGIALIQWNKQIKSGISNYNSQDKELDFSENLYLNKIKREISKILRKEKEDTNVLIFKDATASGLQNYGVLMGYKEEKLKYLNIDGDD